MSLHIHRFVDLIKATESRGQRDIHMTLKDAKDLHADITKLLITLEQLRTDGNNSDSLKTIEIEITGGGFKTP